MKNAVLVHGKPGREEYFSSEFPSSSNAHWFPWLQKQLLIRGIDTQTPEMSRSYEPDYALWCREFERYDLHTETLVVGHSCGAGFMVRWLSEDPSRRIGKLILVAPSLGLDWNNRRFFDFEIRNDIAERTEGLVIFGSDDDKQSVQKAIKLLRKTLGGVQYRGFHGKGHFTLGSMGTDVFPELLEACLGS